MSENRLPTCIRCSIPVPPHNNAALLQAVIDAGGDESAVAFDPAASRHLGEICVGARKRDCPGEPQLQDVKHEQPAVWAMFRRLATSMPAPRPALVPAA